MDELVNRMGGAICGQATHAVHAAGLVADTAG
jgi:hypothetical protein